MALETKMTRPESERRDFIARNCQGLYKGFEYSMKALSQSRENLIDYLNAVKKVLDADPVFETEVLFEVGGLVTIPFLSVVTEPAIIEKDRVYHEERVRGWLRKNGLGKLELGDTVRISS